MAKNFIKKAIKRPGALTKAVGGAPAKNLAKVKKLAQGGSKRTAREARFYLNVLKPAAQKRRTAKKK